MDIGNRIKQRRELLGMSQEDLAHKVGYKSRSSINKIETDGRGLPQSKIIAFAKALETTPAYLMGWEEIDSHFSGKEASQEVNDKLKKNIENHRQKTNLSNPTTKQVDLFAGKATFMKLAEEIMTKRQLDELNRRLKETLPESIEPKQPSTLAAHFDGNEYTEDELDEIKQFAEFVKGKRGK